MGLSEITWGEANSGIEHQRLINKIINLTMQSIETAKHFKSRMKFRRSSENPMVKRIHVTDFMASNGMWTKSFGNKISEKNLSFISNQRFYLNMHSYALNNRSLTNCQEKRFGEKCSRLRSKVSTNSNERWTTIIFKSKLCNISRKNWPPNGRFYVTNIFLS